MFRYGRYGNIAYGFDSLFVAKVALNKPAISFFANHSTCVLISKRWAANLPRVVARIAVTDREGDQGGIHAAPLPVGVAGIGGSVGERAWHLHLRGLDEKNSCSHRRYQGNMLISL